MDIEEDGGDEIEALLGFTSNFPVKLDSALRLPIPAKFRSVLNSNYRQYSTKLVVAPDKGKLRMFPIPVWMETQKRLEASDQFNAEANARNAFIYGHLHQTAIDAQSRIRLPQSLADMAGLKKDVVVVGKKLSMEIWDAAKWAEFSGKMVEFSWDMSPGVFL